MAKNILLILGHPSENSFCKALLDAYQNGGWFYFIYRASQYQILKDIVFGYVGFDPIRFSTFGFMRKSTDQQRSNWIKKMEQLGKQFK